MRRDGNPGSVIRRRGFAAARDGVAAVEFALVLPLLLLLVLGAYQVGEAVAAYRKVTITANTVANLASRNSSLTATRLTSLMNASAQIMAPFPATAISIVVTEFTTDAKGNTTVAWSQALNDTALTAGATSTLPAGVAQVSSYIVLANVTYNYAPVIHYFFWRALPMKCQIYMFPRISQSILYNAGG